MARKTTQAADAAQPTATEQTAEFQAKLREEAKAAAEAETQAAEVQNKLPQDTPVTNPAPADDMEAGSGAYVEPEAKAVDASHPSVENNPRQATSAIQNGHDWNDPTGRTPEDPSFVGQGVDKSVYGR